MKKVLKAIGIIVALLAIYFAAQLLVTLAIAIVRVVQLVLSSQAMPDINQLTNDLLVFIGGQTPWIILIAVIITLPFYYLIYRKHKPELRAFVAAGAIHPVSVPVLLVFGVSMNFLVDMLLGLIQQIPGTENVFKSYDQVSSIILGGGVIWSLLAVGIAGPIFEELLFRGLVFGELRKLMRVRLAIVLQALIFGIYHMNLVQGTYAFLIGLLLGFIYYRSRSIIAPMLVHIAVNSSSVLIGSFVSSDSLQKWGVAIAVSSVLLFVLSGAFVLAHRSFKHAMDDSLYEENHLPMPPLPPETGAQG